MRCQTDQASINLGHWSDRINISQCRVNGVVSSSANLAKLTAEVLDQGTGNRVKGHMEIDNSLAGFELIPLRPGFYRGSSNISILIKSTRGPMASQEVEINVRCISTDKKQTVNLQKYEGRIGFLLKIPFSSNLYEHTCRVMFMQAHRKIGGRFSRPIILVLPSVGHSGWMQYGWIQWSLPNNATYRVGEKFRASVPLNLATKLNYLVVCRDEAIIEAGRVRDDGEIIFETTDAMVPYCVLYVFSADGAAQIDMILFFVELSCKNSLSVSKTLIGVSDNLTVTINGGSNGLALLSAVDIRMLELMQKYASNPPSKYWDLSTMERSLRTLFLGLIDSKNLNNEIGGTCEEAGVLMLQHLKRCPNFIESSSAISNLCLRSFILACERLTGQTTTSKVCDRKTEHGCGTDKDGSAIKLASAQLYLINIGFGARNQTALDDTASTLLRREVDLTPIVRQYFPEVWIFEDYNLGASGGINVTIRVPDTVTQWSVQSSAWTPGDLAVCRTASSIVATQQKLFMTVDLPRHVYINESVAARVSVFAEQIEENMMLSICMAKLDRHVCGDVGAHGERGQPAYARIHLTKAITTSARMFALRFLRLGETEVIFTLKEEISYPGQYHCNVGEIYDAVKLKIIVAKRAETTEHFKRLVLNPRKPFNFSTSALNAHYLIAENETENGKRNVIDYHEYRLDQEPHKLFTNISINLPDTESIHSITIDLSQFLPEELITDSILQNEISSQSDYRWKRSILGYESFLTDILSSFAPTLYQFKSLNPFDKATFREFESLDDTIGSLISAMLTFSSCHGATSLSCAFSNYRKPKQSHDESFFLTALSTSLLCEATVDERIVCPLLSYLLNELTTDMDSKRPVDYFLDHIDFTSAEDRYWLVKAMVNQLASDCIAYQCARNDRVWINLRKSFYNLPDHAALDIRTVAALAFMAPRSLSGIMRIKLYSLAKDDMLPYWTSGRMSSGGLLLTKFRSEFSDHIEHRIFMNDDLLINSLGLLSFVSRRVDPMFPLIELDLLADWIYEQLNDNGQTLSALDAYFANRAIYEYRIHKTNRRGNNNDRVTVNCKQCKLIVHNVTNTPTLFYLPTTVRNITLITEGNAKVRAGIRVVAAKRMRLRRGLEQSDLYPTKITVMQHVISAGVIQQEVCLKILTSLIESLEVTHGLFTGFTSQNSFFQILQNTTLHGIRLLDGVTISNYAVHFILTDLKPKIPLCYKLIITEPRNTYEPNHLAPVAITVRHPLYDIAGQELVTYTERFKRSVLAETIDMVCWDGSCSCAEASCTVRCSQCGIVTKKHLQNELCSENMFGATVEVESYRIENLSGSEYFIIEVSLKHWKQNDVKKALQKPDRIEIWLRTCNILCAEPKIGETYYFSGNINGIVVDFNTRMHYVLRDDDRWELASEECGHLFSYLITSGPCLP
uniref:A2M domain-containing protein n=1 Tax=Elaeophora elaphi TaxID=1147741 RepID=A0A158Q840_9BILA